MLRVVCCLLKKIWNESTYYLLWLRKTREKIVEWVKIGLLTALFEGDRLDPVFSVALMSCLPRKRHRVGWDRTCFLGRWESPSRHLPHPDLAGMAEMLVDKTGSSQSVSLVGGDTWAIIMRQSPEIIIEKCDIFWIVEHLEKSYREWNIVPERQEKNADFTS